MLRALFLFSFVTLIGCDSETERKKDFSIFEECDGSALGMEHGHIKDADITASSTFDHHSVGPHIGRVRQDLKGGAWCPANSISEGVREWLEINLRTEYLITGAETMGRYGGGQGQEFAQEYQLEYWRPSTGTWHLYTNSSGHQVMQGNVNTYMANKQELSPSIVATKVRFLPHSKHPRTVCMRVELFGCPFTSPVASYQVLQGDQFSPRVYLEDVYDGREEGGLLTGGLGLLSDGKVGPALTFSNQGLVSAPGWVGWTNKKFPLQLSFVLSSFQSLQSVSIATFNKADMGIAAPSKVSAFYKNIRGSQQQIEHLEVLESSSTKDGIVNIKYNLAGCVAKEIGLLLHFGAKWIILSEVHFSSETVNSEYLENTLNEQPTETGIKPDMDHTLKNRQVVKQQADTEEKVHHEAEETAEQDMKTDEPNSVVPLANGDSTQMYIGITIGILSMSVLLLLFTIFFILRKNKHRIFSKHSMFMSNKGPDVAATDIRLRLSPLVYNVGSRRRISEYHDRDNDHEKQIYDEPHRPIMTINSHKNILKNKNKSCDMLCQYENFCIRDPGMVNMNNFGSTPMFNVFTVDHPSIPRAPPPTSYSTTNFKDRYPAYDYSTPLRIDTHPSNIKMAAASESDVSDNFYAASDILNFKPETSNSLNWSSFIPSSVSKNDVNHY